MKHLFIINPVAGQGEAVKLREEILSLGEELALDIEIYETKGLGDGEDKARKLPLPMKASGYIPAVVTEPSTRSSTEPTVSLMRKLHLSPRGRETILSETSRVTSGIFGGKSLELQWIVI